VTATQKFTVVHDSDMAIVSPLAGDLGLDQEVPSKVKMSPCPSAAAQNVADGQDTEPSNPPPPVGGIVGFDHDLPS